MCTFTVVVPHHFPRFHWWTHTHIYILYIHKQPYTVRLLPSTTQCTDYKTLYNVHILEVCGFYWNLNMVRLIVFDWKMFCFWMRTYGSRYARRLFGDDIPILFNITIYHFSMPMLNCRHLKSCHSQYGYALIDFLLLFNKKTNFSSNFLIIFFCIFSSTKECTCYDIFCFHIFYINFFFFHCSYKMFLFSLWNSILTIRSVRELIRW